MRNALIITSTVLIFFGCSKDKFTSVPQLKYKSVNTIELHQGEILEIKLSYTDKEGDLQDSIFVEQLSTNCPNTYFKDSIPLPNFPSTKNSEGDILIRYGYRVPPVLKEPQCNVTDTCYFRFVLKDEAKNKSDTVRTEAIYLIK